MFSRRRLPRRTSAVRNRVGLECLEHRLLLAVSPLPSTPALYNPATATFYLRNANDGGVADTTFIYGPAGQGWVSITGDWDGDGVDTVGLYEPGNSVFFLSNQNTAGAADISVAFGPAGSGWTPIAGDWDGDGDDTIGLYNPATGTFFLQNEFVPGPAATFFAFGPGGSGWLPLVGDWDGDGTTSVGVYNPVTGTFYTRNDNAPGNATTTVQYGPAGAGWIPLAGDWDGDGIVTFGVRNPVTGEFHLRDTATAGSADVSFGFGPGGANWSPLIGTWIHDADDTAGGLYATPGTSDDVVPTKFTLLAELADFNNELGLYIVDDSSGSVNGIPPGAPGYAAAALSDPSRQVIFPQGSDPGDMTTLNLPGDSLFALYLIQDNNTANFLAFNPTNQLALIPRAFFSLSAANPDDFDHVKNLAPIVFAWEDRTGGGDQDFNDAIVLFQFGAPVFVPNTAPVAAPDSYTVDEDTTLAVDEVMGVLGNDTDPDGDALTAVLQTGPSNGTLVLDSDGSFTYTPNLDFNGTDTFTYRASDGDDLSAATTVTIVVNPTDEPTFPVANNDTFTTAEGATLIVPAPGVLGNDTDPEGDTLTAVLVTPPANGSLAFSSNGSFTYTPVTGFSGTDTFTYRATDGTTNSNIATVTIVVTPTGNDAPVAVDDAFTTDEGAVLSVPAPGVLGNDTDADGDTLTAVLNSSPTSGSLLLNPNGSFVYTPNAGFSGTDSFTYTANDGTTNSNIATVTIVVNPVNNAPVAVDDTFATADGVPLVVTAPGVLANDTDADGDALTAVLETGPANGTLVFSSDGSFTYTPNPTFTGTDTFTYHANDGSADSNTATVTITVGLVNTPPVAADDEFAGDEGVLLFVPAPGVLGNDTDADGDTLTAVLDSGPSVGTLVLNPDGSFTYAPDGDFNGSDSFTYHANDGQADSNVATVFITIAAVNDAPVAINDSYTTAEGTPLVISAASGVLANDTDPEGDSLNAVLDAGPANGTLVFASDGSFVYTPNAGFSGTDTFTYHANDGQADSNLATVSITVTLVNTPPVAVDDQFSTNEASPLLITAPGVLANDTDADGDALSAVLDSGPSNGVLVFSSDGSFAYTPNAGFTGVDSFTYHANDGNADSNVATVSITVTAANLPAIAVDDTFFATAGVDLIIGAPGVLGNDVDPEGAALTAAIVSTTSNGTLTLNADGSFTYSPAAGFTGTDSFTYVANDGNSDSNVATAFIIVEPADGAPLGVDDTFFLSADTTLTTTAGIDGVLENDSDPDADPITAVLISDVTNGTLTLNADGSFSYTPTPGMTDFVDTFTYVAFDGSLPSNVVTVNLFVGAGA